MSPRERMARAIASFRDRPDDEIAAVICREAAAICRERCAEIRGRIDLMDDDATAARFEQRALVAWQLARDFRGGDADER